MLQDLTGKTAIITGASSGFGRASAYALAREGVNLVLTTRTSRIMKMTLASMAGN